MEETEQVYVQKVVSFSPLNENDQHAFASFKTIIDSKLRKTFPSILADFELNPVSVHRTQGCGMFYDFKVALPDNKFVKVSFNSNAGYCMGRKISEPTEDSITIDMELTSTPN